MFNQSVILSRMTAFPPDAWECRQLADFNTYVGGGRSSGRPHMTALMAIRLVFET
jgi:hypothetical protein